MGTPRDIKEVQKLTMCLAALHGFISQMGDKCKPLFDNLKKENFQWSNDSQVAFEKIKEYLADTKILA